MNWLVRRDVLDVARGGVLMGIVNVTPDSFPTEGVFMRRNALSPMQKSLNGREPLFWT